MTEFDDLERQLRESVRAIRSGRRRRARRIVPVVLVPLLGDSIREMGYYTFREMTLDGMPLLIDGMVPPEHKNLYFFGAGQPRYGAGPLISAAAELLCTMIATQRRLRECCSLVIAACS